MDVVDQFVEQLDLQWAESPFDSSRLRELISMIPPDLGNSEEVLVEVCASDLEWRWQSARRSGEPGVAESEVPPSLQLPRCPTALQYREFLGGAWESEAIRSQMWLAEWRGRSAFGDRPDIREFERQAASSGIQREQLLAELDGISKVCLRVLKGAKELIRESASQAFVLGRQARGEPNPPAWIESTRRLVVVPKADSTLSREQICVERIQVDEFLFTNLSQKVTVELDGSTLRPGDAQRICSPLNVIFGDVTVIVANQTA